MKFFRLLKGELNKILMRPILYVITAILVVALVFSYMLFNQAERTDGNITSYDSCETITDTYNTFNSSTNRYGKSSANSLLESSQNLISASRTNNEGALLQEFQELLSNINETYTAYLVFDNPMDQGIIEGDTAPGEEIITYENLQSNITELRDLFETSRDDTNSLLLIKTADNLTLNQVFINTTSALNAVNRSSHASHVELRQTLQEIDSIKQLTNLFSLISYKTVDEKKLVELENNIVIAQNYMNQVEEVIYALYEENNLDNIDSLKELSIRYYLIALNAYQLTQNVINYSYFSDMQDSEIASYFGYADIYMYQINEQITKQTYLLNNNAVSTDYANVFSPTRTSNSEVNAFDFVYFGLEVTGFIILIFTVVLAAGMLAGEQSSGTLKLLLIRPYSRGKILTSKLLATMIFATIFLIFSTIVLFLIGLFTMGANFTPVLCIFNASTAFITSPFVVLLIYLLCWLFKMFLFVLLALAISAIFRSNVGAVGVSIVLYFVLSIFALIFAGSYWYGYLPFSNLDLFKYFGGAFVASGNSSPLSIMFSAPYFHGGSFLFSFLISLAVGVILALLTYVIFKKREIK